MHRVESLDDAGLFDLPGETRAVSDPGTEVAIVVEPSAIFQPGERTPARLFTRYTLAEREEILEQPVRRLNTVLTEVLDYEAYPDRGAEETIALINDAMETFADETREWTEQAG